MPGKAAAIRRPREGKDFCWRSLGGRIVVGGSAWVGALLLGALVVAIVAHATTAENVDTAFSGFLWTLLLVGVVVGMIWVFGAWIAGG